MLRSRQSLGWVFLGTSVVLGVLSHKGALGNRLYTLSLWYGTVTWETVFLLLGCFLLVSAFPLFLSVLLHDTFLSSSVTTATAGGVLL